MKSPLTGKEMILKSEESTLVYKGVPYNVIHHYYLCETTNEQFTTTELDEKNLEELNKQVKINFLKMMEEDNTTQEGNTFFKKNKVKVKNIVKEYRNASPSEIWEGVRDNFIFGFLGAMLVVFIATRADIAVLLGYLIYYNFMGKIVNRPKYVTDLGKLIVFPIPSALGAFVGYKLSYILLTNMV